MKTKRSARTAEILRRYFRGMTAPQIAGDLGMTRHAVQQCLLRRGLHADEAPHGPRYRTDEPISRAFVDTEWDELTKPPDDAA